MANKLELKKQELKESISSKKFLFVIGCVWALFAFAYIAASRLTPMVPMFDTFVGGVLGLAGLYLTGNVANKWVMGKVSGSTVSRPDPEDPEASPEVSPPPEPPKKK